MNYQTCTVEELADFVEVSPAARITQQLIYYRDRGVVEMVEKIKEARRIVKKRKLLRQLEAMQ
jgi:hypothetical protein